MSPMVRPCTHHRICHLLIPMPNPMRAVPVVIVAISCQTTGPLEDKRRYESAPKRNPHKVDSATRLRFTGCFTFCLVACRLPCSLGPERRCAPSTDSHGFPRAAFLFVVCLASHHPKDTGAKQLASLSFHSFSIWSIMRVSAVPFAASQQSLSYVSSPLVAPLEDSRFFSNLGSGAVVRLPVVVLAYGFPFWATAYSSWLRLACCAPFRELEALFWAFRSETYP